QQAAVGKSLIAGHSLKRPVSFRFSRNYLNLQTCGTLDRADQLSPIGGFASSAGGNQARRDGVPRPRFLHKFRDDAGSVANRASAKAFVGIKTSAQSRLLARFQERID